MVKKLQNNILALHTSDFKFCVNQIYLCTSDSVSHNCRWPGAVVKAASAWKVGDRGKVSSLALSFRFQDISSSLTRKDSILWGTS